MAGKVKYKVGDEFHGTKRIVEYCGSHPKFRVSTWKWECLRCGTINGPSMTATLTRKDRTDSHPRCCYRVDHDRNPNWKGHGDITKSYYNSIYGGAKNRGLEFSITIEDMWNQWIEQRGRCSYTGWELTLGYRSEQTASLDRIDSSEGYTKENIQWVHKDVNRMKWDCGESRFLDMCKAVADFSAGRL